MVLDSDLVSWNQKGLIPAPGQTEAQFIAKLRVLKDLHSSEASIAEVQKLTHQLFDFKADWLRISHRNKGLSSWEGAMTWQEFSPEGFSIPFIQIREDFERSFLRRWYPVKEVLAHEAVHAVRSDFRENVFEEILAYQTSSSSWRRWVGPLLQNPGETKVFLGLLLISFLIQWLNILFALPAWWSVFLILPWAALGWGFIRLTRNQATLRRCLHNVGKAIGNPQLSLAVALRLTDWEIRSFARSSPEEVREYAKREEEKSLRWKMIALVYFR